MPNNYDIQQFPKEYADYNTQYPGVKETIGWTWYDVQSYVSTTTVSLTFFTTRQTDIGLGNMKVAGQLAAPQAFFCRAIGWMPFMQPRAITASATTVVQTGVTNDLEQLKHGIFILTIGDKLYGQYPLWRLPAGGGVVPFIQTGDVDVVVDYANNGVADARNVFTLSKPLFIAPQISFSVQIVWGAALTLASGNIGIMAFLDGDLLRPVQ